MIALLVIRSWVETSYCSIVSVFSVVDKESMQNMNQHHAFEPSTSRASCHAVCADRVWTPGAATELAFGTRNTPWTRFNEQLCWDSEITIIIEMRRFRTAAERYQIKIPFCCHSGRDKSRLAFIVIAPSHQHVPRHFSSVCSTYLSSLSSKTLRGRGLYWSPPALVYSLPSQHLCQHSCFYEYSNERPRFLLFLPLLTLFSSTHLLFVVSSPPPLLLLLDSAKNNQCGNKEKRQRSGWERMHQRGSGEAAQLSLAIFSGVNCQ